LRDNLDLHGQKGVSGNGSGHTRFPIRKVRRYAKPPPAAYPHSFHSIEEPREHENAVNAQGCDECSALILNAGSIHQTPWLRPANRITMTEPHLEANVVPPVSLDRGAGSWRVIEKLDTRFH
jgi:hypothetical protein